MAASDPMDISTPTPHAGSSPPELSHEHEESEDYTDAFFDDDGQGTMDVGSGFVHYDPQNPEQTDDIDLPDVDIPSQPIKSTIPPLKLGHPRSYAVSPSKNMWAPKTLAYIGSSPPVARKPITVLLALTPHPASLKENKLFETLALRFCSDFSNETETWSCVSLYGHFRAWAAQYPNPEDAKGGPVSSNGVGIGSIHPFAMRARLQQQKEAQWRLSVPVLQELIAKEVEKGASCILVFGLRLGDVEGLRAFGQRVAKPAGVLAFLPEEPLPKRVQLVTAEYDYRTVMIEAAPPSQTNERMLAAIHARSITRVSGKADVIDLTGSSSDDDDDDDDDGANDFDAMEGMLNML